MEYWNNERLSLSQFNIPTFHHSCVQCQNGNFSATSYPLKYMDDRPINSRSRFRAR